MSRSHGISLVKGSVCFVLKFALPPFSPPLPSGVRISKQNIYLVAREFWKLAIYEPIEFWVIFEVAPEARTLQSGEPSAGAAVRDEGREPLELYPLVPEVEPKIVPPIGVAVPACKITLSNTFYRFGCLVVE